MREFPGLAAMGALCGVAFALVSCGDSTLGSHNVYHPDIGPFDEDGNYVEALADAPVKKNHFDRSPETAPEKAKPAESRQLIASAEKKDEAATSRVVSRKVLSREVVAKASYSGSPAQPERAKPSPRETVVISQPQKKSPPPAQSKPKPKPKVVSKPDSPKPKPQSPIRYTVQKGDTLYSLSRKYDQTVSAIQKANDLAGNTILTGSTLLIPR